MAGKVKGPSSPASPQVTTPTGSTVGAPVKSEEAPPADPTLTDAYQKAAQGILSYKSSPLVSGAYKIFSDGIVFPPNILDIKDPRNDPKYLRLLAAAFGLDELERYFFTLDDEGQEKLKKVMEEKREKRKKNQEEKSEEDKEEKKEGD